MNESARFLVRFLLWAAPEHGFGGLRVSECGSDVFAATGSSANRWPHRGAGRTATARTRAGRGGVHLPGALPASRRQSFGLETGRKMRFCSFKPPGLTRFVTAAQDSAAEPGNSAGTSHVLVPGTAFKSSEGPRVAASHTLRQTRGRPRSDVTAGPSHWASPLPETKRSDAFLEGQGSGSPRGDKARPSTRTSAKAKTFFPSLISLSTELTRDCPFTTMIDSDTLSVVSGDILFLNFFFLLSKYSAT